MSALSNILQNDNFLDKSDQTTATQNEASIVNHQMNKINLLRRMQEKSRMNDILSNLDKKLTYSKHSMYSKYISHDTTVDTASRKNPPSKNITQINFHSRNRLSPSSSSSQHAADTTSNSNLDKFRIVMPIASKSSLNRTHSNRKILRSDLTTAG